MTRTLRAAMYRRASMLVAILLSLLSLTVIAGEAGDGQSAGLLRPVAVWASSPIELTVAFAASVDPELATNWRNGSILINRERQPVDTVRVIPAKSDTTIAIAGVKWVDQGRTAILQTDPQSLVASYFVPLPIRTATTNDRAYVYDLSGVELTWMDENVAGEEPAWMGWWPVLDSAGSARVLAGTSAHQTGEKLLAKPGRLTLSSLATLPAGNNVFGVESSQPIEELIVGDQQGGPFETKGIDGLYRGEVGVPGKGEPGFVSVTIRTGFHNVPLSLRSWYRTAEAKAERAIERSRLLVPWVAVGSGGASAGTAASGVSPDLAGGDAKNGKILFQGQTAKCSQCHRFRGEGGSIGPDLSEIGRKPIAEIYRSIAAPSAEIDPLYLTYTIATKEGQVLSGVVRSDGAENIRVLDTNSHTTVLGRERIRQIRPSANSVMPVGLAGVLGEAGVRDVMAYLISAP